MFIVNNLWMKTFINNDIFMLKKIILNINYKKMFIKSYENFSINLNVINSNTLVKYIIKCLIMITILIKL